MKQLKKELERQKIARLLRRENGLTPYIRICVLVVSIVVVRLLSSGDVNRSRFLMLWLFYGILALGAWMSARYRWITEKGVKRWWLFSYSLDIGYAGVLIYYTGGVTSPVAPLIAGSLLRVLVAYPHLPSLGIIFPVHLVVFSAAVWSSGGSAALSRPEFWCNSLLLIGIGLKTAHLIRHHDEISLAGMRSAGESAELKMLAETDGLTRVYNFRYFQKCLIEEMRRAARFNIPISLLIFDIDFFKIYNDTFGHPAGDRVLVGVAEILRNHLRNSDILCRYGGDEFVAILVGANGEDAAVVAGRAKDAVQNYPFFGREYLPRNRVSISVGVATYPEDASNYTDLIAEADRRLYIAKAAGERGGES